MASIYGKKPGWNEQSDKILLHDWRNHLSNLVVSRPQRNWKLVSWLQLTTRNKYGGRIEIPGNKVSPVSFGVYNDINSFHNCTLKQEIKL